MGDTKFVIYVKGVRTEYFNTDEESIKTVTMALINGTFEPDQPVCSSSKE